MKSRQKAIPGTPVPLRWWWDTEPAIKRHRHGSGFGYVDPAGRRVEDRATLRRIRSLAIPPAWTDVRICPLPDGHLQAVGRDARGRKQYRYHAAFRAGREAAKFGALTAFAAALPAIRRRVEHDLARPGLPREKVLALVVRLLDLTHLRVGSEEYRRENRSFGLTTLRNRHATVEGSRVRLRFRGKSGVIQEAFVSDRRLARLVRRCQEIPGQELFQYLDELGQPRDVRSDDVNEYLREVAGPGITAKQFRTWAATVVAYRALVDRVAGLADDDDPVAAPTQRSARSAAVAAMRDVAAELGNTPTVARKSYVHPAIIRAHHDGSLPTRLLGGEATALDGELEPDELATLAVLEVADEDGRHEPGRIVSS